MADTGIMKFTDLKPAVPGQEVEGYGNEDGLLRRPYLQIIQKTSSTLREPDAEIGAVFSQAHNKVIAKAGEQIMLSFLMVDQDWTLFDDKQIFVWCTQDPTDERLAEQVMRKCKVMEAEGKAPPKLRNEYDAWWLRMYRAIVFAPFGVKDLEPSIMMFTLSGMNFKAARDVHGKMKATGRSPYEMAFGMTVNRVDSTSGQQGQIGVASFTNPKGLDAATGKVVKAQFDANRDALQDYYGANKEAEEDTSFPHGENENK